MHDNLPIQRVFDGKILSTFSCEWCNEDARRNYFSFVMDLSICKTGLAVLWGNPLLFFCSLQRLIRLVFFGWNLILGRLKLSVLWLYNGCCGLQGECTTKKWIWECRLVDVFAFTRSFLKQMPHPQPLQARNGNWNITTSLRDTPWPVCCSPLHAFNNWCQSMETNAVAIMEETRLCWKKGIRAVGIWKPLWTNDPVSFIKRIDCLN